MNKHKSYLPYIAAGTAGALVASALPLLLTTSHAETRLLPFQGRLTDAAGTAMGDGVRVVEFKMYDAPTGGTVKWAGEVHKLSVNGGLVNTMLGSKASLGAVDFASPVFLQITVDANGDGQITAADPPLLPRQSVIPAVYASVAGQIQYTVPATGGNPATVAGKGWEAVFNNGNPDTGSIPGSKLAAGSVKSPQLDANSVTSSQIADGTIQGSDLSIGLQQGIIPAGTVVAFAGKDIAAPPGWALCDGRSVLRTDPVYAGLFAVIETNHGSDDPARFNLPDYRGRFLRGISFGTGDAATRDPDRELRSMMNPGGTSSATIGSVQEDSIQNITGVVDTTYAVVRGIGSNAGALQRSKFEGGVVQSSPAYTQNSAAGRIEFNASDSPGARTSSETRPKNAYVNYIIKL